VQSFHPMRVADWFDLVFNGMGVVSGWLVILLLQWRGKRNARR